MLWPTNAQLSHTYIFRHYRVILRQLVINTLPRYTSMSNVAVEILIVNCITDSCICNTSVTWQGILGNCPTWRTNSFQCIYLFIYSSLHVSSMSCSSSGETNCINTASGNCHSVLMAAHDTATNTKWQLPEVVLTKFVSPDDEHDMLETCRDL